MVTLVISISRVPQRPSSDLNPSFGPGRLFGGRAFSGFSRAGVRPSRQRRLLRLHDLRRRRGDAGGFGFRELVLFRILDVDHVGGDDALGIAFALGHAVIEPVRDVAELLDQVERVRHQQDRLVAAAELRELVEALVGEALVADRQHFVDQQHVGIDVHRHGEAKPHVHAGGIGLDRRVDEVLHLRELDDLVEAVPDLLVGQAEHDAVDEDVLAAGDLGVEAGAQLDQRRDAAINGDRALGGPGDAGDALEQRALAGAVAADHTVGAALRHRERHVAQRLEGFVRLQVAEQAAVQDRRLERRELLLLRVAPVDLRDVGDFNGGGHQVLGPGSRGLNSSSQTSSAKLSRSRSNTKYPARNTSTETPAIVTSHFQCPCGPGKNSTS